MNVNLHIDSIVLDGIEMGPGQRALLQQIVSSQLSTMLKEQSRIESPFVNGERAAGSDGIIHLGHNRATASIGPQLANAIYTNIPQSHFGLQTIKGGQ